MGELRGGAEEESSRDLRVGGGGVTDLARPIMTLFCSKSKRGGLMRSILVRKRSYCVGMYTGTKNIPGRGSKRAR